MVVRVRRRVAGRRRANNSRIKLSQTDVNIVSRCGVSVILAPSIDDYDLLTYLVRAHTRCSPQLSQVVHVDIDINNA